MDRDTLEALAVPAWERELGKLVSWYNKLLEGENENVQQSKTSLGK